VRYGVTATQLSVLKLLHEIGDCLGNLVEGDSGRTTLP